MDRRIGSVVLTQQEIGAQAQRSTQTPGDTDRVNTETTAKIENERQADDRQTGACQDWPRGPGTAPSPVPADQHDRRQELQQQSNANREVLHGAEVAELRYCHR